MATDVYEFDKTALATYASFAAWVSSIGVANRSVIIGTDTEITGTVVSPANIDIVGFANGAKFTGSGSLTINRMSCDPQHQIFANTLTVSLAQNWARPEWFGGGFDDDTTDETVMIQHTIDSLSDQGIVELMPKIYRAVGLSMTGKPRTFRGAGYSSTSLKLHSNTNSLINIVNTVETVGFHFKNMQFFYNYSSGGSPAPSTYKAVAMTRVALSSFENCLFSGFSSGLDFVLNCSTTDIINCVFGSYCGVGIRFSSSGTSTNIKVLGCFFDENTTGGIYCNSSEVLISGCNFKANTGYQIRFDAAATKNTVENCQMYVGSAPLATTTAIDIYGSYNKINVYFDQHVSAGVLLRSGAGNNSINVNQPTAFASISDSSGLTTNYFKKTISGRSIEGTSLTDDTTTTKQVRGTMLVSSTFTAGSVRASSGNVSSAGFLDAYKNTVVGDNFSVNSESNVLSWIRRNISYTELSAAGLTINFQLFPLPVGAVIEKVYIKPITQFVGTGITSLLASVGVSGAEERYMIKYNIFAAPEYREFKISEVLGCQDSISTSSVSIFFTSAGGNLNALTAGEIIVGVQLSMMRGV